MQYITSVKWVGTLDVSHAMNTARCAQMFQILILLSNLNPSKANNQAKPSYMSHRETYYCCIYDLVCICAASTDAH